MYKEIMNKIISAGKKERFEGSHAHRVIPGHQGGRYTDDNVVYLSQREHSILHYLLWKINGLSEDYRASKMIGTGPSGLSHNDRVSHGRRSAELGLGFHDSKWDDYRHDWQTLGRESQKRSGSKNTFYYWSSSEGRKERASLGGKASMASGNNPKFKEQMSSFKDRDHAKRAGAKAGRKWTTNGVDNKKFKTNEDRNLFISQNEGWRIGLTKRAVDVRRFLVYNIRDRDTKSFYTDDERNKFIMENAEWKIGRLPKLK